MTPSPDSLLLMEALRTALLLVDDAWNRYVDTIRTRAMASIPAANADYQAAQAAVGRAREALEKQLRADGRAEARKEAS